MEIRMVLPAQAIAKTFAMQGVFLAPWGQLGIKEAVVQNRIRSEAGTKPSHGNVLALETLRQ